MSKPMRYGYDGGRRLVRRRTVRAGLAAAVALSTVVALPGVATAAEVPEYRVAENAEPVKGTARSDRGPELGTGIYTDTIGRGERKFYSVNLDDRSSTHISAIAAPRPGTRVAAYLDGIEVQLTSTSNEKCHTGNGTTFGGDGTSYPIGDYATRRIGGGIEECQKAGPYLFSVKRTAEATADPGQWPIEIRHMSEPGLKGSVPGPPGVGSWSSEPPTPPAGKARRARGGTGFNDAGAVGTGVWKDTVLPGETRFYRVPVDWGQQISATAELPVAPVADDGTGNEYVSSALGLQMFNPARGVVVDKNFESYNGDQTAAEIAPGAPVEYGNRFADDSTGMCFAGWYYLEVTLHPDVAQYFPDGAPVSLRVSVEGEAREAPAYDGDAVAAGFGLTDKDKEAAEKGRNPADVADSDSKRLIAWAGIGTGSALVLGLALWTLVARRRAGYPAAAAVGSGAGSPGTPTSPHLARQWGYGPPNGPQQ